ncbi:DedA family protein [Corynebacterium lubricantis]|uniref:DedA family protein n=1 Tax=Corynebacterium lubricantis TaxID=541095 RepID=UPI0003A5ECAF|nr:VTT domain-containing protein [Corynebacterium lubricantis]
MEEILAGYPFWAVWLFLYFGATIRGQATYWIGRGVVTGATRTKRGPAWWQRTRDRLAEAETSAGHKAIERVGIVAIPFAYVTVGLQSAIILAAGLLQISWRKFSLAQIPGAVAWATIYSTIGFAAWASVARALAGDWWPLVVLLIVVAVIVGVIQWRRRRSRDRREANAPHSATPSAANEELADSHTHTAE